MDRACHGGAALRAAEARRRVAFRPLERVTGPNYLSNREGRVK